MKISRDIISKLICYILLIGFTCGFSQPADKMLSSEEQVQILRTISRLMIDNYIHKDIGVNCAQFIENRIEENTYSHITHPREFARRVTEDLRSIHQDKHIRLQSVAPDENKLETENPLLVFFLHARERQRGDMGIREIKIISGNIGYLDLRSFEPLALSRPRIINALQLIQNTDAIIIDLRNNNGGNPETVQFLCSWFFNDSLMLNQIFWRRGNDTEDFRVMDEIGIPKRPQVPLFILSSVRTFSAGEEFAYNLQALRRATIIGEQTAGGANPGYSFTVNDRFHIFIPTGESINPVTLKNWEGTGVTPDIAVVEQNALSFAIERAARAARIYREKLDDLAVGVLADISRSLYKAVDLFKAGEDTAANEYIRSALWRGFNEQLLGEWEINALGYRYLAEKDYPMALALLSFNEMAFPQSANVYDSLGEVYMKIGLPDKAQLNFRKSLQLDPDNQNARLMLDEIRTKQNR